MGRFNARTRVQPEADRETPVSTHPHPSEGDPGHGIPPYPNPLPGEHHYPAPEPVHHEELDVGVAQPYYTGGMAHGVRSPIHHGGRPAPRHEDREAFRTEQEAFPAQGHYKVEPIPVYFADPASGTRSQDRVGTRQVTVKQGGDPVPLVERSDTRTEVRFLIEGSTGGIRLRMGPNTDIGALIPSGTNRYEKFHTQEQMWAVVDSAASDDVVVSIIEEFKVSG